MPSVGARTWEEGLGFTEKQGLFPKASRLPSKNVLTLGGVQHPAQGFQRTRPVTSKGTSVPLLRWISETNTPSFIFK